MKNSGLILLLLIIVQNSFAGDLKFPVDQIPDSLKSGVNAVVRQRDVSFKILEQNRAIFSTYMAITILNEKGNDNAHIVLGYNKLSKVKSLEGAVYDASGKLIKKLKSSEIHDQSSYDGFSLYSDYRLKYADISQVTYPYTVEFEYELEYRFLYGVPDFDLFPETHTSIQNSSYELAFAQGLRPRFKTLNLASKPSEFVEGGLTSLKWRFGNIKPGKEEPFSKDNSDPKILVAPSKFEYDGYVGDMSNWDDFGRWVLRLNEGRDELSEATKQKIKEITAGMTTQEQKVQALYTFLQGKTRYVSIQIGIGGVQPFPASVVEENGYGDCKALSNYMVALLKAAGVKGYYTLISAGNNNEELIVDFPSHQYNHAIVSVPNGADTLWLECTSQTNPFDYQGKFTGDRRAMMITEDGGKIVNTIRYPYSTNTAYSSGDIFIDKSGNASARLTTMYSGLQYENAGLSFIADDGADDQKKWLQKNIDIPNFDIKAWKMTSYKKKIPSVNVNLDLQLNRLATVSGKRLFLTPNLMNRISYVPPVVENRKTDVFIKSGYTDQDTLRYHIPEELYPEFLPEPIKINSRFGTYEASFKLDQGNIVYIRKMTKKNGSYPAESYKEMIDFYKKISKADNTKLVFLNKT